MTTRTTRLLIVGIVFWTTIVDLEARGPWVTLQGCHFLIKRANDGDSFHVSVGGKEYIFRLYFVDAPETDTEFRDRVEEQARYFQISVDETVRLGELAKQYTRERLTQPFIVRTCWEDAMGRSRLPRYFAFVQTNNGDLGEQLIENGLARVLGSSAKPEGLSSASAEWKKLRQLEKKAQKEQVGGWGVGVGRITARAREAESTRGVDPFDVFFHPKGVAVADAPKEENNDTTVVASSSPNNSPFDPQTSIRETKLDVNTASAAELENINGIGPALAKRIIAARPLKSADDLQNVKGVGSGKKYEQIRPYFQ
jgi:DNA uptake protein ComE-like DNA-binding protein